MTEGRFIRVSNGAIYRYSEALMNRRDAQVVTGQTAADHFRARGVSNDITEAYPPSETTRGVPEPPARKSTRRVPKKATRDSKTQVVVSEEAEPDALKEILGDGENLL